MPGFLAVLIASGPLHGEIRVAALHSVAADLARRIGGDRVEVVEMMTPGGDPHVFEPGAAEIRALAGAQIVLSAGFEDSLKKWEADATGGAERLDLGGMILSSERDTRRDPHWWQSVANVRMAARAIRDALIRRDPEGRDAYTERTREVLASLDALETWIKSEVAVLPKSRRVLVTLHDAFGYFAREFGFEALALQDARGAGQTSPQRIRDVVARMRASGIRTVFSETGENPKVLDEILRETGARVGGALDADGLGAGEAATYEGMMRRNTTILVEALREE